MLRIAVAALVWLTAVVATGCHSAPSTPVQDVGGGHDVTGFTLQSVRGTRDGENLGVRASYGDGTENLDIELDIEVTPPTRLRSGTWKGLGKEGNVRAPSLTFLGGQSGSPSVGGRFELLGPGDRPIFVVNLPLQELKAPL